MNIGIMASVDDCIFYATSSKHFILNPLNKMRMVIIGILPIYQTKLNKDYTNPPNPPGRLTPCGIRR